MCDQDLEAGVAIVDIGGGTTDLAVFYEGILKHTAVIPFGGENITNDIKTGLGVLKTQAEQMKIQFGSALSDEAKSNAFITIPGLRGMAPKEISVKNLAGIIQARMSEIMDFVTYHLKQVGLDTPYAEWWCDTYRWRIATETFNSVNRICYRVECKNRLS